MPAEDIKAFPAGISAIDGLLHSGWMQAMWSSLSEKVYKGMPAEGIILKTVEEGDQRTLSDVVASLFTGLLETDEYKVEDQLRIADYLQVQFVAMMDQH